MKNYDMLIFELSKQGRVAYQLPPLEVPEQSLDTMIPAHYLREKEAELPQVSELDVARHYTLLSKKNYNIETGMYPLGSCTMKYNPKINEDVASLDGFLHVHPYQPKETVQGCLQMISELQEALIEITGMDEISLQPAAGSHGELTGLMIIKAYHESRKDEKRTKILIPDSAHGTNPASAAMVGLDVIEIPSTSQGIVDMEALEGLLNDEIAGLMLTNPNTLGLFEKDIVKMAEWVHDIGGLLYYDGANMNANMGITRPGDMGFDIVHLNLHKSFSTPHGGGGPGSGPVGVKKELARFLPNPLVHKVDNVYTLAYNCPDSIGRVRSFYGNFGVYLRAYAYILTMGKEGLKRASEIAVLNANYLQARLKNTYILPVDGICKHEFVLGGIGPNQEGITTLDIVKRMMDYGYHPPTIYFPLIIEEAMMIEPTETESLETLDAWIETLEKIAQEAKEKPELLKSAPHHSPVRRLDEVQAARKPVVMWRSDIDKSKQL
ncbi:MAG: aminomethyl-transferring glycine dehydrogenase subunit GcvPB [Epulopiscium sp.]|nr:aminomethyl-transferring glycine dehydrogenase subunit GcvPB [Candidatus Epulonipiscium sp.]